MNSNQLCYCQRKNRVQCGAPCVESEADLGADDGQSERFACEIRK